MVSVKKFELVKKRFIGQWFCGRERHGKGPMRHRNMLSHTGDSQTLETRRRVVSGGTGVAD